MSDLPFVLVPPSEAKVPGGDLELGVGVFDTWLDESRHDVVQALVAALDSGTPKEMEKLFHVRGPLLARALDATHSIVAGRAPLMPAAQRYSGVVWSHLDPMTLAPDQRTRLLIPSGLYGVTSGEDPIADYRLKMNVALGSLGVLTTFWRPSITRALAAHIGSSVVVNLLPQEHGRALDLERLERHAHVVTVTFVQRDGSGVSGHAAKGVKGIVARRVLLDGVDTLTSFRWQGWRASRRGGDVRIVAPRA